MLKQYAEEWAVPEAITKYFEGADDMGKKAKKKKLAAKKVAARPAAGKRKVAKPRGDDEVRTLVASTMGPEEFGRVIGNTIVTLITHAFADKLDQLIASMDNLTDAIIEDAVSIRVEAGEPDLPASAFEDDVPTKKTNPDDEDDDGRDDEDDDEGAAADA